MSRVIVHVRRPGHRPGSLFVGRRGSASNRRVVVRARGEARVTCRSVARTTGLLRLGVRGHGSARPPASTRGIVRIRSVWCRRGEAIEGAAAWPAVRYTTRVEEACLNVYGATWLPPRDTGLIKRLVLDVGAPPRVAPPQLALIGSGRRNLAKGRVVVAGFPTLDRVPLIKAGISMGPVSVEVSRHASVPAFEVADWEDAAEFSVLVRDEPGYVGGFSQDHRAAARIDAAGPGWYRLRVHAKGRAVAPDLVVTDPTEEYLIQVWRAGPAEAVALTDSVTQA